MHPTWPGAIPVAAPSPRPNAQAWPAGLSHVLFCSKLRRSMRLPGSKATASKSRASADCSEQRRRLPLNSPMRHHVRQAGLRLDPLGNKSKPLSVADLTGTIPRALRPRLAPAEDPERSQPGSFIFCRHFWVRKAPDGLVGARSELAKSRQCSRRRQNSTSLSARLLPTHRRSAWRAHAGTIEDESRSETCSTKPSVTPVLTASERVLAAASPTRQGTFKYRNRFRSRGLGRKRRSKIDGYYQHSGHARPEGDGLSDRKRQGGRNAGLSVQWRPRRPDRTRHDRQAQRQGGLRGHELRRVHGHRRRLLPAAMVPFDLQSAARRLRSQHQ